jgi:hypothetical protein
LLQSHFCQAKINPVPIKKNVFPTSWQKPLPSLKKNPLFLIELFNMKTKEEIVENWLPRYTGNALADFGEYILLTNFSNYVSMFAEWNKVEIIGKDRPMQCATANNITIILEWAAQEPLPLWIYSPL